MSRLKIELEQQVVDFVRSLAPEPRQDIRRGLKNLENEAGDIRALEGELEGFYRLRVLRYPDHFLPPCPRQEPDHPVRVRRSSRGLSMRYLPKGSASFCLEKVRSRFAVHSSSNFNSVVFKN